MKRKQAKKSLQNPKAKSVTQSNSVKAKKKSTTSDSGWGIFLKWVQISERDLQRLTVEGVSVDDVKARINKRRRVFLDARGVRDIGLQRKASAILQFGGNAKYFLVAEDWQKKRHASGAKEDVFDRGKLRLGVARCAILADDAVRNIVYFGIGADAKPDFDVIHFDSKNSIYYVVTRDNKRQPVIFKDE